MRGAGIAVILLAGSAAAAPVDPQRLPAIAASGGSGERAIIYSAGADADLVLDALGTADFVAIAGAQPLDGRIDAASPAAFDAIAARAGAVRLPRGLKPGVELDRHGAPALDILRELADAAGTSYVFAPTHALPAITIRAHHVDALETARAIAKLVHVELVETHGAWVVVEPGTILAAATLAHVRSHMRLEINHAHPGEARRLIEPDELSDRNLCPPDTWVDASLHGEIGVLEAVLDTLVGPPCEQHPDTSQLDTGTASLVGVLVEPRQRRAVFRVPGGARALEPDHGERIEINYVVTHGGASPIRLPAPHEPSGPLSDDLVLRATVRVGSRSAALLRSPAGDWRLVRAPGVDIGLGSVTAGEQSFVLER
jgi:hypothetical protein